MVCWHGHFQHWKLWGPIGNPRQDQLCLLPSPLCLPVYFKQGKGMGGMDQPVMAPPRASLSWTRPTFSPRDSISLKLWVENLNFKCVQAEGCAKVPSGKPEIWKLEISFWVSFLRTIWHWLMLVFFFVREGICAFIKYKWIKLKQASDLMTPYLHTAPQIFMISKVPNCWQWSIVTCPVLNY